MMSNPRGSIWRKWDLHVHARRDANYTCLSTNSLSTQQLDKLLADTNLTEAEISSQERQIDSQKYAKLLLSYVSLFTDLSVIAITNHNSGDELDEIIDCSQNFDKITIFPGAEVTSCHGIHIICIFNPANKWRNTWKDAIEHFLTEIGISSRRFNNGNPLSASCSSQQILEKTAKRGGICIFAHIQTENGLFKQSATASGGTAHSDIYTHELCNIVQLPSNATLSTGISNIIEGRDASYGSKTVTKIKCSDARKLTDIGRDFTWIKADPTFEGLKQIIYEPDLRVKIQTENPSESEIYAKISKATINLPKDLKITDESGEQTAFCINGKYDLEFSNNLTCIIGERGCGKSTIAHILYNSGMGETSEKLMQIESPLKDLVLTLTPLKNVAECVKHDVPSQTEFFFQNEIEHVAKSIQSMSRLVRNRLEKLSSVNSKQSLKKLGEIWHISFIRMNELIETYDKIAQIEETISVAIEQKRTLQNQTQVITSEDYKQFQTNIDNLSRSISTFNSYRNDYEGLIEKIGSLRSAIDQIKWNKAQGEEILKRLIASLDAYKVELKKQFDAVEIEYNQAGFNKQLEQKKLQLRAYLRKKGLAPENIEELADANQKITELEEVIRLLCMTREQYTKIYGDKKKITKNYQDRYEAYKTRFYKIISSLQEKLARLQISDKRITFELHIDDTQLKGEMADFIQSNIKDKTVLRDDYIIKALFAYINLNEFVKTGKIKSQVGDMSDNRKHMQIVGELLGDKVLLEKLHLRVLRSRFTLRNIQVQTKLGPKLLKNTSFGERCGIVVAIILVAGTNPIVIDQPEDHLGEKFISQVLVPLIKDQKRNRQTILITRNANIVIGGDAELIHILELPKERTEIVPSTIENIKYRDKYIWILDGGEEAFLKREQKYAFSGKTN